MLRRDRSTRRRTPGLGAIGAIGSALVGIASCAAAPTGAAGARSAPPASTEQRDRDIRYHATVLRNAENPPDLRAQAAELLLRMEDEAARQTLADALRSGDGPLVRAVAEAMRSHPRPVPELLGPTVAALRAAPADTLDLLSMVLARHEDAAFSLVAALAINRQLPVSERLGAVHALGAFATTAAGDKLMDLANPARGEVEAVRAASFASLRRLARADLRDDYETWRSWWEVVREKPAEEWARELIRHYQLRGAELEQAQARMVQRYLELLRSLYRSLPQTELLERLTRDLEDELSAVREFAMERVSRLLRDGVLVGDNLRGGVVERLDDPDPALRARAARLLDEQNEPQLAVLLGDRLAAEPSPVAAEGYLRVLARRPARAALDPILARLGDERASAALRDAAADALWALLPLIEDPAARAAAHDAARAALRVETAPDSGAPAGERSPAILRLLASVGDEEDVAELQSVLRDGAEPHRAAVAEGLCRRGAIDLLRERAGDAAVYPFLLCAVEREPGLATVERLVALPPPDGLAERWAEAVRTVAAGLDPEERSRADDLLAAVPFADARLRSLVLMPAVVGEIANALDPAARVTAAKRLVPLLVELGEALRGLEIIESLGPEGQLPILDAERFIAAVHAGRFDVAALVHSEPGPWVAALAQVPGERAATAVRLRDAIRQRFPQLPADLQAKFDAACAALPPSTASTNGSAEGPP
jgi:hypothetical protein